MIPGINSSVKADSQGENNVSTDGDEERVVVPRLKDFFEKLVQSPPLSLDGGSLPGTASPRTPSPKMQLQIAKFDQVVDSSQMTEKSEKEKVEKRPSKKKRRKRNVSWKKDRKDAGLTSSTVDKVKINMERVPSFAELQSVVTPRSDGNNPPPLKREGFESSSWTTGFVESSAVNLPSSPPLIRRFSSPPPSAKFSPRSPRGSIQRSRVSPRVPSQRLLDRVLRNSISKLKPSDRKVLCEDDWMEDLPKVSRNRSKFNKEICERISKEVGVREFPKPKKERINQKLLEFTKGEIERHLIQAKNDSASPRSSRVMRQILSDIQTDGLLTEHLMPRLIQMKRCLIQFLREKNKRTDWSLKLAAFLSYLIYYRNDLTEFMCKIDNVRDKEIVKLLQEIMESAKDSTLFNLLRTWSRKDAYVLLEQDMGKINILLQDSHKIQKDAHLVCEPEDAFVKFSQIHIGNVVHAFTSPEGIGLKTLSINEEPIDISNLVGSSRDQIKAFFSRFLTKFYQKCGVEKSVADIGDEAERILLGNEVPCKELLWLCVNPWRYFSDRIRLLFPGLQNGITTNPEEKNCRLNVAIDGNGEYRITRLITYHCTDSEKKVASIDFYWTVSPCETENQLKTWCGCIQIPNPVQIHQDAKSEQKHHILKSLIDHVDPSDPTSISKVALIDDSDLAIKHNEQLVKTFDNSSSISNVSAASAFAVEFMVKNFCRRSLERYDSQASSSNSSQTVTKAGLDRLATNVWRNLQTNGLILELFICRLQAFEKKLHRYILMQAGRTAWTNLLLTHVAELVCSEKYGDYGTDSATLNSFIKIIDHDIRDESIRRLLLNVMCGGWENSLGKRDNSHQLEHISKIMGILKMVNDSPVFIKKLLQKMVKEGNSATEIEYMKPEYWVESRLTKSPISVVDVKQIVRCFMPNNEPLFQKLMINGTLVSSKGLGVGQRARREEYFTRVLTLIYRSFDPQVSKNSIQVQVTYILDYEKASAETKGLAEEKIPCLRVLRLCVNSNLMVADIFFRNLYDLNNPPLKSNDFKGRVCSIRVHSELDFSVQHDVRYGVYPRERPDDIGSNGIIQDQLLTTVPFTWTLTPFNNEGRDSVKGILQVRDVVIEKKILSEYAFLIKKALGNPNTKFRDRDDWQNVPRLPIYVSPLSLSDSGNNSASSSTKNRKCRTPRGRSFTSK